MAITPFTVTDFRTSRKPICDFLLVISTNLPHILHCFQVMADYMCDRRAFHFNALPCEYRYKWYTAEN